MEPINSINVAPPIIHNFSTVIPVDMQWWKNIYSTSFLLVTWHPFTAITREVGYSQPIVTEAFGSLGEWALVVNLQPGEYTRILFSNDAFLTIEHNDRGPIITEVRGVQVQCNRANMIEHAAYKMEELSA